jgi:hypothetical protein
MFPIILSRFPKRTLPEKRFKHTTNYLTSRFKVQPTVFSEIG